MLKFRTSILALDPHAKLFVDGNPLKVIHSKCGGQNTQRAMNDTSNFREHISVCQGPHTFNAGNGSPKSSPQRGSTRSTHPTTSTPPRPGQLPCPGFSFESLFGKDYRSLLSHEREQVTRAAGVAGLIWLNSRDKGSVISMSCLKKSPSNQEPAQPCHNCSKVLELSNFKDTLSRGTPKFGGQRFSPWQQLDPKATGAGHQKTTDVSQPLGPPYPILLNDAHLEESLVPTLYCHPTYGPR